VTSPMAANHVDVRRTLTKTPLARQHETRLNGKVIRRPKPIDWDAFDRRQFPKPAIDLAVDSYIKLAIGSTGPFNFMPSSLPRWP
jgi:hypothetical protein